jgi:hypothetical protein
MRRLDKNESIKPVQLPSDINTSTIELIYLLNELAKRTKLGFIPFSEVTDKTDRNLIPYVDKDGYGEPIGAIVSDMDVNEVHHDIIHTYNDFLNGVVFTFCPFDNEQNGYILVRITDWLNTINIVDGYWQIVFD